MNTFVFTNHEKELTVVHRAELPVGIQSKTALLEAISSALEFPDYFGGNWDALEECIRDLSWLPDGDIIISHKDLPLSEDLASLLTYLSILKNAIKKWSASGKRKLFVFFPADAEGTVRNLIGH